MVSNQVMEALKAAKDAGWHIDHAEQVCSRCQQESWADYCYFDLTRPKHVSQ